MKSQFKKILALVACLCLVLPMSVYFASATADAPYDQLDTYDLVAENVGLEKFVPHPEMGGKSVIMRAPSTLADGESYVIYKNEGNVATAISVGVVVMDGWTIDLAVSGRAADGEWTALEHTNSEIVEIPSASNPAFKQAVSTVTVPENVAEVKVALVNTGAAWTFAIDYVDITWSPVAPADVVVSDPLDTYDLVAENVGLEKFVPHPEMGGKSVIMRAPATLADGESYVIYKNDGEAKAISVSAVVMDGWGFDLAVSGRAAGGEWIALEYTNTAPAEIPGASNPAFKQADATVTVPAGINEVKVALVNTGAAWTFAIDSVDITWGAASATPDEPETPDTPDTPDEPVIESATITFDDKAKMTEWDDAHAVWAENGITVTNNQGASVSAVKDYAKPARFYKNSELIVAFKGITKIVFNCNSEKYATDLAKAIEGVEAVGTTVTITFETPVDSYTIADLSGGQVRLDSIAINPADEPVTPDEPETPVEPDTPVTPNDPAADSTLTIAEAIALGLAKEHNVYTEGKYYVSGVITEVYNTTYGNMRLTDADGNVLTVYGTYSADGNTRYDALDVKPVAGDTVKVYGIIGQYNGTPQVKNGWIVEHIAAETPDEPVEPDTPVTPDEPETPDEPTNAPTVTTEYKEGVAYKLGLEQAEKGETYYFTGAMSGYYGATETDVALAVDMYVEIVDGGYKLFFNGAEGKQYIALVQSGTHYNFTFGAEGSVFSLDTEKNAFHAVAGDTDCYMGTYGSYVTVGTLKAVKDTDYIARLYTTETETPDEPVTPDEPKDEPSDEPTETPDEPTTEEPETDVPGESKPQGENTTGVVIAVVLMALAAAAVVVTSKKRA